MRRILNSSSKVHRAILDERLASYLAGKSKPIPHAELMRRLRADHQDANPLDPMRLVDRKPPQDVLS